MNWDTAAETGGAREGRPRQSAELLLDLLRVHQSRLRAWHPDTVEPRRIQLLCEYRRKLINNRIRHTNRITSLLKMYFSQALDWTGELDTMQSCDFLEKWPTLACLQQVRPAQLRKFYQQHHCRNLDLIEERLTQIRTARALTEDSAIVDALSFSVQAESAQLRPIIDGIARFDQTIAEQFAAHPEHELFESFPVPGFVYAPRLMIALGTDRSRWDSAADLQCHSGIAPVTKKSGKSCLVHRRLACPNPHFSPGQKKKQFFGGFQRRFSAGGSYRETNCKIPSRSYECRVAKYLP